MLMILIMKVLNFMSLKKITARLNKEIIFALMYFVIKRVLLILFMYQMKNLINVWFYS